MWGSRLVRCTVVASDCSVRARPVVGLFSFCNEHKSFTSVYLVVFSGRVRQRLLSSCRSRVVTAVPTYGNSARVCGAACGKIAVAFCLSKVNSTMTSSRYRLTD